MLLLSIYEMFLCLVFIEQVSTVLVLYHLVSTGSDENSRHCYLVSDIHQSQILKIDSTFLTQIVLDTRHKERKEELRKSGFLFG